MKISRNGLLAAVTAAALVLALGPSIPANAQVVSRIMIVQIPFDFHVGAKGLPAGTYTVEKRGDALALKDRSGNSAFILTMPADVPAAKRADVLVFSRYLNNYFLSEARWEGQSVAGHLIKQPSEISLASKAKAEVTTIAATVR